MVGLGLGFGLGFYGVLLTLGGVLVTLKWHNGDLVSFRVRVRVRVGG